MSIDRAKTAKQAEGYLAAGKPAKAIDEFYALLEDNPGDLNLANRLGDILLQEKRDVEAMDLFRRSALGFENDGFANKAIAIYRKAFRISPHDRGLATRLLALYERLCMNRDAMHVRLQLAEALAKAGRAGEAAEEYAKIVDLDPLNAKNRVRLAELSQAEGQGARAAEQFIRAAEVMAPEKAQAEVDGLLDRAKRLDTAPKTFLGASRVCAVRNDFVGAKRHLEHGLEANPKDTDLIEAKAEMELRLSQPMAALESLVAGQRLTGRSLPIIGRALKMCQVIGTAGAGVETIEARVKEFARRGFADEARAALAEALGVHPVPAYWLLLADLSRIGGRTADRIDALKYALSLYPHDDGHYLAVQGELMGLGVAHGDLISHGPPDLGGPPREPAPDAGPGAGPGGDNAESVTQLCEEAQRREAGGDAEGAAKAYAAALDLDTTNMGIVHSLAELHRVAGAPAKARDLYSKMAEKLCAAARPDLALQCLERADELSPGSTRALRLSLADALAAPPRLPRPLPHQGVATAELPDFEPGDFAGADTGHGPGPGPGPGPGADASLVEEGIGDGLHQALYSIDFQLEYGSHFDAKVEIEQALLRYPGNAELLRRLAAADDRLGHHTHAEPAGPGAPGAPGAIEAIGAVGAIEAIGTIGAIEAIEAAEAIGETNDDTGAFAKVHTPDEIYGAFRDEVEKLVEDDDYDTSYNLGIGYREMGLVGPAIEEFKKAMRDPWHRLECCSMIAMCEEARGDFAAAMGWLRRGIDDRDFPPSDSAGMRHELALLVERAAAAGG